MDGLTGTPLEDPAGDYGGGKIVFDIVGADPDWAGYWYEDGATLYFRVRLGDTPQASSFKWESFNFFVAMEIHPTPGTSYDDLLYLDGNSDRFADNATQSANWCGDAPDADVYTYPAPPDLTGHAAVSTAGTT